MTSSALPDINVWLALSFESHIHHRVAAEWFSTTESDSLAFCRMTQQGLLRLASNPAVMKAEARSLAECWQVYDALLADDRVVFQPEPQQVEPVWRRFTGDSSASTKIWNDAYLAAFAICAGMELVTFDKGFQRYEGLQWKLLE